MKNLLKIIIAVIFSLFAVSAMAADVYAVSEQEIQTEEIAAQVNEMLEDYDISYTFEEMGDFSLTQLFSSVKEMLAARVRAPFKTLGTILIVVVFTALIKSAGETAVRGRNSAEIYNLVCVLTAVTVISPMLLNAYANAGSSIDTGGSFMMIFVPVLAGITAVAGHITSAGVYNLITLFSAELIVELSRNFIMPMLTAAVALAVCGSVFENSSVNSIINLFKKVVTWSFTVALTLFSGFVSMKCALGARTDGFGAKTMKFVISGFIPVVGSAVSDAYSTVRGGFDVIRCSVGIAGAVAVVMIMLPPVIEIFLFRAVMWIGGAVAEMFSVDSIARLMKNLDSGLAIAMSVLVSFGLLFIICTGILMNTGG